MDPLQGISKGLSIVPSQDNHRHTEGTDFLQTLKSFYHQVDQEIKEADRKAEEFAVSGQGDLHNIMIATEKADLHFKLLLKIRNKLLEAYQEITRMQF
jgi:flagellar hook-basal body complex protein FliE